MYGLPYLRPTEAVRACLSQKKEEKKGTSTVHLKKKHHAFYYNKKTFQEIFHSVFNCNLL